MEHLYVIGIDYGTDSVRALLADAESGEEIAVAVCNYSRWGRGLYCDTAKSQFRQHPLDYLEGLEQDVIFRTPGLHPRYLAEAAARGSVITSEMEVFFDVCPCPILAVTGSDGKTTTTTIIARLLQAAGHKVHLGGNIGHPLLSEADDIRPEDWAVVEVRDRGRGLSPEVYHAVKAGRPMPRSLSGDSTRGMGIGLSVCQNIIKAHGGFFTAGNRPEGGAVFRFGLPTA